MSTTIAETRHDAEPKAGMWIEPDAWGRTGRILDCDWDGATFRIAGRYFNPACEIEVSGRVVRQHRGRLAVRCRIEWIRDGEENAESHGWLYLRTGRSA